MNWSRLLFILLLAIPCRAHIGSPNVFFEGEAGPYPIRVTIRPPPAVPGLAEIAVRVQTNGLFKVSVLPARWDTGRNGAPPPDIAQPVKGETNFFSSQLWLMDSGAYSVFVNVDGAAGPATAIVPINSMATARLPMPRWMSGVFLICGAVLFVMLAGLVGAAVREGTMGLDEAVSGRRLWRGRLGTAIAIVAASALLYLGKGWWDSEDKQFRNHRLYKQPQVAAAIKDGALELDMKDKRWNPYDRTELVPDHGKLMHLFLIEEKTGRGFAHLHPVRQGPQKFLAPLPKLPAGKYHLYADITHDSGFTQTLLSSVEIPEQNAAPDLDRDDAFSTQPPTPDPAASLADSLKLAWEKETPLRANAETTLRFSAKNANGTPAQLEPYLGMYAHAVIWKNDGKVFQHLHPLGTISMTAQALFAWREKRAALANKPLDIVCGAPPKEISFPYAFPETGHYGIWVQFRVDGQVRTAAFAADVL